MTDESVKAPVKKTPLTDIIAIQRIRRMRDELGATTWQRVLNFLNDEAAADDAARVADAFRMVPPRDDDPAELDA
jgi:hypothetical protein